MGISASCWLHLYSEGWSDDPPRPSLPSFKMVNLCRVHVLGPPGCGVHCIKPVACSALATVIAKGGKR